MGEGAGQAGSGSGGRGSRGEAMGARAAGRLWWGRSRGAAEGTGERGGCSGGLRGRRRVAGSLFPGLAGGVGPRRREGARAPG